MCWIVSVFVDVRAAPGPEVHLTSGRRSHTDSVFGIKWTAGRVVSVPSHNRACTLLVVFIAAVTISSRPQSLSVQVADPCSQIKTGDVTIHSEPLVHCIPGCIRDQFNRHISRPVVVYHLLSDRTCAHSTFGAPASRRRTCTKTLYVLLRYVRIRCSPKCSFGSLDVGSRGAIPDSTVLLPPSHCSRQTFCCPSVSDRVKHELWPHGLGARPGWSGASAVGCSKPKLKTSRMHNDPRVRALGEVSTHVSRFSPSTWWTHQEMS